MENNLIDPILQELFRITREAYANPPYVIPIKKIHITRDFLMRLLASEDSQKYLIIEHEIGYKGLFGYPLVVHEYGKSDWWFECIENRTLPSLDKIEHSF